jgi:hypothetical protein
MGTQLNGLIAYFSCLWVYIRNGLLLEH